MFTIFMSTMVQSKDAWAIRDLENHRPPHHLIVIGTMLHALLLDVHHQLPRTSCALECLAPKDVLAVKQCQAELREQLVCMQCRSIFMEELRVRHHCIVLGPVSLLRLVNELHGVQLEAT